MNAPRPTLLAAVTALAMLTVGCGANSSGPGAAGSTAPSTISTASGTPTTSPTGSESKATALLKRLAAHMIAARSVHMTQVGAEDVTGDFVTHGAQTDFDMTISAPGSSTPSYVVRATHGTVYISIPSQTGAGKFAKVDPQAGPAAALLTSVTGMQPGKSLITVAPAVRAVRDAGAVTIDGERTEHYVFRLDSLQAHELLNPGVKVPQQTLKKLPKGYDYNLYATPDDLVRRVRINVIGTLTVINYTDWGSPIQVTAPSRADLVPAPDGL